MSMKGGPMGQVAKAGGVAKTKPKGVLNKTKPGKQAIGKTATTPRFQPQRKGG